MDDNHDVPYKRYNLYNLELKFKDYLKLVNKSPITIKNYLSDFRHFIGWLIHSLNEAQSEELTSDESFIAIISQKAIRDYRGYLSQMNLPTKTINRRLSTVRIFCSFCISSGLMTENPSINISNISTPQVIDNSVPSDIIESLNQIDHVDKPIKEPSATELARYISFALAGIVLFFIGFGIYLHFFNKKPPPLAYAVKPVFGARTLSFQARLTDSSATPITSQTNATFRLYDSETNGNTLYETGICTIVPDREGIFSVLIGKDCGSGISNALFTDNPTLYLGATIGTDLEMKPRQPIATVNYAANADTLQNLPLGTGAKSVPFMNESGIMLIDPKVKIGIGTNDPANALSIGANSEFQVDLKGNIIKINDIAYSWPTLQGGPNMVLTNDGTGGLTWKNTSDLTLNGNGVLSIDSPNSRVGIGTVAPGRTLDVTGNWGGNAVVDARTDSTSQTITEWTKALVYHLSQNSSTTNSNITDTFNITGLPNNDGTIAYIYTFAQKGATGDNVSTTLTVQINGTQVSSVTTGFNTAATQIYKAYTVVRSNNAWHIVGGPSSSDLADLAEWIGYVGEKPAPGELVSIGPEKETVVRTSSPLDPKLAGIVSTAPNTVMGKETNNSVVLALSGRVPVKVTTENGVIRPGDYLTSSSTQGAAMKAMTTGPTIGKALESYDGNGVGSVVALVSLSWYTASNEYVYHGTLEHKPSNWIDKIIESKLVSPIVETNTIKPDRQSVVFDLSNKSEPSLESQKMSEIIIKGLKDKTVALIDAAGNGSFSGTLTSDNLVVQHGATISGQLTTDMLTAREIESNTISALKSRLNSIEIATTPPAGGSRNNRDYSSDIDNLKKLLADINSPLVDNKSQPIESLTGVANSLTTGNIIIQNDSIQSLSFELKLSALSSVNILDGAVTISRDGKITTTGEIIAKAGYFARGISVDTYMDATNSASLIPAAENYRQHGINAPAFATHNEPAGNAILPANSNEVVIYNDLIGPNSLIYITPTSSSANKIPYIAHREGCTAVDIPTCKKYFKVAIDEPINTDITFNWWIVQ